MKDRNYDIVFLKIINFNVNLVQSSCSNLVCFLAEMFNLTLHDVNFIQSASYNLILFLQNASFDTLSRLSLVI